MTKKNQIQLFNDRKVRTVWDSEKEEWYFSVVDVVGVLTDSADPKRYWSVLKTRMKKEGVELTTICSRLKLPATDGRLPRAVAMWRKSPDLNWSPNLAEV